ncbi:hypothetical protein GALMADRAFT_899298 [Galerina marginata CBS 339.88]|uniref:Nephrocystin 3-like N-terminal domain-containing protein n=1 Tax=Galerina marginata (strain CBS 339.88) TaxID=685588 RepID=A0A067SGG2_GALM3|nr:hypothetical protein GALMADRAFT_899298 [Galerina marginata CBS 339.88]
MFSSAHSILITGGTFVDHPQIQAPKGGFERLQKAVAPGAFHNSGERFDPPKCHPNTRVAVIKWIMDWIHRQHPDTRKAFIVWLYGAAGAGKSAIAQTLAELCYAEGKLLASFFFSKNDPLRGTARALVATLAYQLALRLPQVRELVSSVIDHDPLIFSRSLEAQLLALIVRPVQHLDESGFFDNLTAPRLIIIDGLDECKDSRVQCNILDMLIKSIQAENLPILFLVASRPESDIASFFNSRSTTPSLARLALDNNYLAHKDVQLFLEEKFADMKKTHRLKNYIHPSWPTSDIVKTLVQKSSGQFIYASTVVKFVASPRHRPPDRLEIILGIRPSSGETPFAELDALYTQILSSVENVGLVLNIIGLLLYYPAYIYFFPTSLYTSTEHLEAFLFLIPGDVALNFADLGSLISLEKNHRDESLCPRFLHASLKDFFSDKFRSEQLYLNPAEMNTRRLQHIEQKFRQISYLSHTGTTLLPL